MIGLATLMGAAGTLLVSSEVRELFAPGFFLLATAGSCVVAASVADMAELFPTEVRATCTSVVLACRVVTGSLGLGLVGVLAGVVGSSAVMLALGACLALAVTGLRGLPETAGRELCGGRWRRSEPSAPHAILLRGSIGRGGEDAVERCRAGGAPEPSTPSRAGRRWRDPPCGRGRRMSVGAVLTEAWGLYRRFFGRFFLTAAAVFAILDLLPAVLAQADPDDLLEALTWAAVASVIGLIGSLWVQAALVELVRDVRDGRADRGVVETYRTVAPRLGAVLVAGILAGLGIAVGLVLLVVPGLILITIWSMIVPAIVIEGRSATGAFGRSREIVRGDGWSVFGLVVVTFLLAAVTSAIVSAVFTAVPGVVGVWLGSVVANGLTAPFTAAVLTTAYFRLTAGGAPPAAPVSERGF